MFSHGKTLAGRAWGLGREPRGVVRGVAVVAAMLVVAPAAHAACPVTTSAARGPAPLRVTFRAHCASGSYRWVFGDGAVAAGQSVKHTFAGGRFLPALTTDAGRQRVTPVTSVALTVVAPRKADYGASATIRAL